MIFAGLLAGGIGTRMGGERPKQFLDIAGKPIIVRTVEAFAKVERFDEIIIAAAAGWEQYTEQLLREYLPHDSRICVVTGGTDRTDSILKVIDKAKEICGKCGTTPFEDCLLSTHDVARPFVTEKMINDNIDTAAELGCAGTAIPAQDTIFTSPDGIIIDTLPPRSIMYQAQTPQTFRIGLFLQALSLLDEKQRAEVTDACGVFVRADIKTGFVAGDVRNVKVTQPFDMKIAEMIAAETDVN